LAIFFNPAIFRPFGILHTTSAFYTMPLVTLAFL